LTDVEFLALGVYRKVDFLHKGAAEGVLGGVQGPAEGEVGGWGCEDWILGEISVGYLPENRWVWSIRGREREAREEGLGTR
jgi:hypothetical protein